MIITDFLVRNAKQYGDEVALVEVNPELSERNTSDNWKEYALVEPEDDLGYRKEMTWKEFDNKANRFANLLLSRGVKPGDKVAILMMNCLEWLPIYFGTLKTGALAVPLNFRYASEEIKYCLDLSDASILIYGPEFVKRLSMIHREIPNVHTLFFVGDQNDAVPDYAEDYAALVKTMSDTDPATALSLTDDAAIYFSSGTTGFPKAILHDHSSLISACETEQNHHGQTRDDLFLCIPPLYHTGAKMHWFGSLVSASPAVLLRGINPKWIIETAANEKASIVWLLVPWAQDILDAIESGDIDLAQHDLSRWRLMHIGAQPVPPSLIKRWKTIFPHHSYDTNYGLSESIGPGSVHLGIENTHKVGAIGKAGHNWKSKIVDEDGQTVTPGTVGELCVSGQGLMKCYYKNPEATAETLKDGWLHTGDMAREDEDGFIYLVDRKKDVVISGGENIYPVQIEDFLRSHPKIKDVAVIGFPDARLGEIAGAIIEIKPNMTCDEQDILDFCVELPRYKRPRKIIFAEVPRNPTGKIEKPKLREIYVGKRLVESQYSS